MVFISRCSAASSHPGRSRVGVGHFKTDFLLSPLAVLEADAAVSSFCFIIKTYVRMHIIYSKAKITYINEKPFRMLNQLQFLLFFEHAQ